MLKLYFVSVAIFAVIIAASVKLTSDKIRENGWMDGIESKPDGGKTLFCVAAVPIVRDLAIIGIFAMALKKKDES